MNGTEDWPLAEIISIREMQGTLLFYVHYVDCNVNCQNNLIEFIIKVFLNLLQSISGLMIGYPKIV